MARKRTPVSITPDALRAFVAQLPLGACVLEFGSGKSTGYLSARGFRVVSVEHDRRFLFQAPVEYVHAPIDARGYYETEAVRHAFLRAESWGKFAGVILDGPPLKLGAKRSRGARFLHRMEGKVLLIDDTQRAEERRFLRSLRERDAWDVVERETSNKRWVIATPKA